MSSNRALARGLILVGAASMLGSAAAYLLSMVVARQLSPTDFGAFGAMLGAVTILSTLSTAVQALTARRVSVAMENRSLTESQAIRLAIAVAVIIIVIGTGVAWPLGRVLTLPFGALWLNFAAIAVGVVGTAAIGIAQGREAHNLLSVGLITTGLSRAAVGTLFVIVWPTLVGVSAGILFGVAIGAAISFALIAPKSWAPNIAPGTVAEFGHITHALIVLFTLTNIDVVLARIFLTEDVSGEYSVGVLLAKIAFFLPGAIVIVLFPQMSAGNSRRAVFVAAGLTASMGLSITLVSFLLGDLVVRILGGEQYVELGLGSQVWLFALEGSAFALVQVLLYARLAAQDRRAVAMVWIALAILIISVVGFRHDSIVEIVTSVVAVSLLLTFAGLFLDVRSNAPTNEEEPLVPIEAAE